MNPDEENNNPLNNPADKPAPTSEPETAPEVTESPEISETPETSETLEIPEASSGPDPELVPESTPKPAPSAETPSPAPTPVSTPQKKSTTTIILLIVVAILIIVGIVVAIILINNNSGNSGDPNEKSPEAESTNTLLVCSASVDRADDSELAEDFNSYEATLKAFYNPNGDMISISFSEGYEFDDEASAVAYADDQKTAYEKLLASYDLSSDPFETSIKSSENNVSVYHFADIDAINSDNAVIFNLKTDENGTVDTSAESIKETYTSLPNYNYVCNTEDATEEQE